MTKSVVGEQLTEIKARSGVTWEQLARAIGSTPEFTRKVASGAKPGRNLERAVSELLARGRVSEPAPRRVTRTGEAARVRGQTAAPAPRAFDPRARGFFPMPGGRLGWTESISASDPSAIRSAVRSAGRGRHRVSFRVTARGADGRVRTVTVGQKGGYRPGAALRRMGDDPTAWLGRQIGGRYGFTAQSSVGGVDVVGDGPEILGVEVYAE